MAKNKISLKKEKIEDADTLLIITTKGKVIFVTKKETMQSQYDDLGTFAIILFNRKNMKVKAKIVSETAKEFYVTRDLQNIQVKLSGDKLSGDEMLFISRAVNDKPEQSKDGVQFKESEYELDSRTYGIVSILGKLDVVKNLTIRSEDNNIMFDKNGLAYFISACGVFELEPLT